MNRQYQWRISIRISCIKVKRKEEKGNEEIETI